MSSAPTAEEIWRDATWLAQAVDPRAGLVRLVQLSEEDYRRESFLDDRLLTGRHGVHLVKWSEVAAGTPPEVRSDARWIFHIGHVGSTLISRLLGEFGSALAVREPRALRDLTFFPPEVRAQFIPTVRSLMSRTFSEDQTAVVKATSMVSEIAAELVGKSGQALFLFSSPEIYLQTILAGDQSSGELQTLAGYYQIRAESRGFSMQICNPAEAATLVWACEMAALEVAAGKLPAGSVLWQDFDAFLAAPAATLNEIAAFLGLGASEDQIAGITKGPLMHRYSKALEYEFGPDARRQRLSDAAAKHAVVIGRALAMLGQAAEKAPFVERALHRSTPDL
jgi:hypothetical protein